MRPWMNGAYFSGGGGLSSTAEDYLRFALMLANGGELDGARILGRRSVETMASVFAPDTLPGRNPGEGFGLGVRVVSDPAARNTWLSQGSFGWSGAYNTHFFIDPKEKSHRDLHDAGDVPRDARPAPRRFRERGHAGGRRQLSRARAAAPKRTDKIAATTGCAATPRAFEEIYRRPAGPRAARVASANGASASRQ